MMQSTPTNFIIQFVPFLLLWTSNCCSALLLEKNLPVHASYINHGELVTSTNHDGERHHHNGSMARGFKLQRNTSDGIIGLPSNLSVLFLIFSMTWWCTIFIVALICIRFLASSFSFGRAALNADYSLICGGVFWLLFLVIGVWCSSLLYFYQI